MKFSISMDNFPMLLLDMLVHDLEEQGIHTSIQVGGEDTVFVTGEEDDIVKIQILAILCDKYHFAKGVKPLSDEEV